MPILKKSRTTKLVPEWRQAAFDLFSDVIERPLLILALVMIPLIIIPLVDSGLPANVSNTFEAIDYFIWGVFVVEYAVKLLLAPRRWHFVTHNPLDLVVVAVPMLRPLRILRSARALRLSRLSRLGAFAGEGAERTKRSLHVRGLGYICTVTGALLVMASVAVYDLEHHAHGATIKTFPDSLWWAVQTVMTIGYGDKVPVTAGARAIAVVLMLSGIALLSVITASLATFFVAHSQPAAEVRQLDADAHESQGQLQQVLERLSAIEAALATIAASQL
jgi:voltage-gated potassium channel